MKRLFIANRGEISRRIAQTARRMGIETVCITDRTSPPNYLKGLVTEFVVVEEESTSLYLNAGLMVELALGAKCDGLHPGFGFLSENYQFAQKVIDAGMTWVGPTPEAIYAMADKGRARQLAKKAGVPCTLGLEGFRLTETSKRELERFSADAGYPLLLKAALGGGGKGMRIVASEEELLPLVERVQSEALSSFGDDSLIIEQYISKSRHVEVQVFGDQTGQVVAFGDRDCSLQRRHQKVLEEAPAPNLSEITRKKLHEAARRLAKEVGYTSAGTVEFLVAWDDQDTGALHPSPVKFAAPSETARHSENKPAADVEVNKHWTDRSKAADIRNSLELEQKFYFLEMNTRLQVEHPVTEEVFGIDLVEWQLRVAQGARLPQEFQTLKPRGHSIEARIYAEDVPKGFLPAPGPIYGFFPQHFVGVRWETGLDTVDEITPKFDPMIAKVVATGETREVAIARLYHTLEQTFIAGPPNNREFVMALLSATPFSSGPMCTDYLGRCRETIVENWNRKKEKYSEAVEKLWPLLQNTCTQSSPSDVREAISVLDILDHAYSGGQNLSNRYMASEISVSYSLSQPKRGETHLVCEGTLQNQGTMESFGYARATVKGKQLEFLLWKGFDFYKEAKTGYASVQLSGGDQSSGSILRAPVPGKVIKIQVEEGQEVSQGQTCLVLESMKMEFEMKSPAKKKVKSILAVLGKQVDSDELLLIFEEAHE